MIQHQLQLNQHQQNSTVHRSVCEALKPEEVLHMASAVPYANAENRERRIAVLAGRIEELISQAHVKWVLAKEQAS